MLQSPCGYHLKAKNKGQSPHLVKDAGFGNECKDLFTWRCFKKLNGCFRLEGWVWGMNAWKKKKIGYFLFHILPFSFVIGVEGIIGRQNETGHCCEDQEVLKQVCFPLGTFSMTGPFPRPPLPWLNPWWKNPRGITVDHLRLLSSGTA